MTAFARYPEYSRPFFSEPKLECRPYAYGSGDGSKVSCEMAEHDGNIEIVLLAPKDVKKPGVGLEIEMRVTERGVIMTQDWEYHISIATKCDGNKVTLEDEEDPSSSIFDSGWVDLFHTQWTRTQLDDGGLRITLLVAYRDPKKRLSPITKEIVVDIRRSDLKEP
jgi:hypothetical protein